MQVSKVYHIKDSNSINDVTVLSHEHPLISGLFACCHSVEMINGEAKGDEIDLQMFLQSKARINPSSEPDVVRHIEQESQSFDVLKINQYESLFQSMSVLVRTKVKEGYRYYIFVKGNPEMIHR
jgi:magnesium-transporting ATPase (P-type)